VNATFLHPYDWRHPAARIIEFRPTVQGVLMRTAQLSGASLNDLRSDRRARSIAYPRFAAMWAVRHLTSYSLPQIGRALGGRDHTTIMHGIRQADRLRESNPAFRALTDALVSI
jgi:chromosomal replication initiator protein